MRRLTPETPRIWLLVTVTLFAMAMAKGAHAHGLIHAHAGMKMDMEPVGVREFPGVGMGGGVVPRQSSMNLQVRYLLSTVVRGWGVK